MKAVSMNAEKTVEVNEKTIKKLATDVEDSRGRLDYIKGIVEVSF